MQKHRKQYSDEANLTIVRLEKTQKRDRETLEGLKNLNIPLEIYNKKKLEIQNNIDRRDSEIKILEKRRDDYISGKLDDEINGELEKNKKNQKTRQDNIVKKLKENTKEKNDKKAFLQIKNNSDKLERYLEKDYSYYYKQFKKSDETLPQYIRDNLKDMPANKGYIWRGCWFFGEKREERGQPLIMFEKNRGFLHIHEITDSYHNIYEKQSSSYRKTLISSLNRVKKCTTK